MHGLTFIALTNSPDSQQRWREAELARVIRLERHRRLALAPEEHLTPDERRLLTQIAEQLQAESPPESTRNCPECRRAFTVITIDPIEIDCCRFCRGIWFDPGELQFFSHQTKEIPSDDLKHRPSRYRCPDCGEQMTEFVFVNPRTLLVDRCPNGHGVYLEDRELERVFEIV